MSGFFSRFQGLSRRAQFMLGVSWLTVGTLGTVYQSEFETSVQSFMNRKKTNAVTEEECDCKALWECMQAGKDCSALETELRQCLARTKKQ